MKHHFRVVGIESLTYVSLESALLAANGDLGLVIYPKSATDLNVKYRTKRERQSVEDQNSNQLN